MYSSLNALVFLYMYYSARNTAWSSCGHQATATYPMRLFYDVSLKAGAEKKIENPDEAMQAYINANKNPRGVWIS